MAGGDFDDDSEITGINVTPLVDITLVLLIIFMVTTSVITNPEGVRVAKPEAASGEQLERTSIILMCEADGSVSVDGKPLADDEAIKEAITDKLVDDEKMQGIVHCDPDADVGSMVRLIDLLRVSGVKKYAIATKKPEKTGS